MQPSQLVMTALGPDRPGIVDAISGYIYEHQGNIEDSRMAVLGSEFAVIMLISGSTEVIANIQAKSAQLEASADIAVVFKPTTPKSRSEGSLPYQITLTCLDHPGVVNQITSWLAAKNINIEAMQTSTYGAPITGSQLFRFEASVALPAAVSLSAVRKELERLAEEHNFDMNLTALQAV